MAAAAPSWATVQQAMVTWALAASGLSVGQVLWSGQDTPQTPRPYIVLHLLTGVVTRGMPEERQDDDQTMVDVVQVTAAAEQTYSVAVDDVPYTYDADPADDEEAIRDALLAELGALSNITVEAEAADSIKLTGSASRRVFHTYCTPADSIERTTQTERGSITTYQTGTITLRVTAHTDSVQPAGHARELITKCLRGLAKPTTRKILADAGVPPLDVLTQQDLTAVVGAAHESRYFADILLGASLEDTEDTPWFRETETTPNWT